MKLLLPVTLALLLLAGCSNYNKFIRDNIPEAGFDSLSIQENFGPLYNFDITATGGKIENGTLSIEKVVINRVTGSSSGHVAIENYHRVLPGRP